MVDLSVDFAGLGLKNPIVSAASSLGNHLDKLKRLEAAGVGAVTTKLISSAVQPPEHEFPYRCAVAKGGWLLMGDENLDLEYGVSLVRAAKKALKIPVIANFVGVEANVEIWVDNARALEKAGADALEMDLYCPMGGPGTSAEHGDGGHGYTSICAYPEALGRVVKALVDSIKVPIIPKINPAVASLLTVASACRDNGAEFLTMSNVLMGNPGVDIYDGGKSLIPHANTVVGMPYQGAYLFPMHNQNLAVLKCTYGESLRIASGGGIFTWEEIVQRIMLGAHTVQLCSALIQNGVGVVRHCLNGLQQYLQEFGHKSCDDIRGISLSRIGLRGEASLQPATARVKSPVNCLTCADKCVEKVSADCLAMSMGGDGLPSIDSARCTGCGWCLWHCGSEAIELVPGKAFVDIRRVQPTTVV